MSDRHARQLHADFTKESAAEIQRLHSKIAALEKELDGWKTGPVPELKGCIPLVLYFKTQADADEFIAVVREAKPNFSARQLP